MSCSPAHLRASHISIFGTLTAEDGTLCGLAVHRCHTSSPLGKLPPAIDVWQGTLIYCPLLKVVVILSSRIYYGGTPSPVVDDARVVELSITDYRADWERGGEDYWVRAELLIRERRARVSNSKVMERGLRHASRI